MSDQYVFELQFKGGNNKKENEFVIVHDSLMESLSTLREYLMKLCDSQLVKVQYVDDENDEIALDSEEEFMEFLKLVKYRSSRGLMTPMILESSTSMGASKDLGVFKFNNCMTVEQVKKQDPNKKNEPGKKTTGVRFEDVEENNTSSENASSQSVEEIKCMILSELKKEIRDFFSSSVQSTTLQNEFESTSEPANEEEDDSDENVLSLRKRYPKLHHIKKKLEKKERSLESKIDQRLEKLEQKKKKLLDKASKRTAIRKPVTQMGPSLPCIMSAVATKDSFTLSKRVTVGKSFLHVWHVLNDGTLPWNNVELRHTWSSPGLEPDELFVKCLQLFPGQDGQVAMRFKAPKSVCSFISYWHFFYQVDSTWQQFGHFVSLTGNTKPSKHSGNAGTSKGADDATAKKTAKQLASAEIAAEMAREAANAAFRSAKVKKASENIMKPASINLFEGLTISESESDTDANNEESEPGFVFVDVPKVLLGEGEKLPQVKDLKPTPETKTSENNFNKKPEQFKTINFVPENTTGSAKHEKQREKEENSGEKFDGGLDSGRTQVQFDMKRQCHPAKRSTVNPFFTTLNQQEHNKEEYKRQVEPSQQMSFPRVDPNVNYTVFPPQSTNQQANFLPPPEAFNHNMTQTAQPNAYPHPFQSSSQHLVFPNPPAVQHPVSADVGLEHFPHGTVMFTPPVQMSQSSSQPLFWNQSQPSYPQPYIAVQPPPTLSYPMFSDSTPIVDAPYFVALGSQVPNPETISCYDLLTNLQANESLVTHPHTTNVSNAATATAPAKPPVATPTTSNALPGGTTPETCEAAPTSKRLQVATTSDSFGSAKSQENPLETQQTLPKKADVEDKTKRAEPVVQILPQRLVEGAINVAATAYSTAWTTLNNLRTSEEKEIEFDPVFENNMAVLVEMGFNNLERNARLLKRFNNDISQVIGVICATGGAHNLDID